MMMTRLMTIARTGRRMNRSVNFMAFASGCSAIFWVWRELRVELDRLVVDHDGRAVSEFERSGSHHLLPGLDAVQNRHEVPARLADAYELLARDLARRLAALRRF